MSQPSFRIYNSRPTSYASSAYAGSSYTSSSSSVFGWLRQSNRWLILVLFLLLVATLFNIRILNGIYELFQRMAVLLYHFAIRILIFVGFIAGNTIELTGSIIGETGDIAEHTLESVGRTLQDGVGHIPTRRTDTRDRGSNDRESSDRGSPERRSTSRSLDYSAGPGYKEKESEGVKWCLIGDAQARKGCIKLNSRDRCVSGRSFNAIHDCIEAAY